MSGRVTVRLTHAQARYLEDIASQAADSCEDPVGSGVFRRASQAITNALAAQEHRRRERAELRERYPDGRPPDDPMLRPDDPRRPYDLSPPWRNRSPW